jgi:hypothetical protein
MKLQKIREVVERLHVENGRVVERSVGCKCSSQLDASPQEQWRIDQFQAWLSETTPNISSRKRGERIKLYERVSGIRPYESVGKHEKLLEQAEAWSAANPDDPLASALVEYAQSNLENAQLVAEAFAHEVK